MAKRAPIYILEGTWWSDREVPLILPYFNALATSHPEIALSHRTIRSAADIQHYVSRIPKHEGALLYFACHGEDQALIPDIESAPVEQAALLAALDSAQEGAISFVHFGCCESVAHGRRREVFEPLMAVSGARWVSGYTEEVDWLASTFLDLALVTQVFVPDFLAKDGRHNPLKRSATQFIETYEQLARSLGFTALSKVTGGPMLFPERLHQPRGD